MSLFSFSLPFTGISGKQRITFYTQLEHMLDAGIPPVRSLRTIAQQGGSRKWHRIISTLADHIETGGSLTSAFSLFPDIFSPLECRMVGAAESSGSIVQVLSAIARYRSEMRNLWTSFWINMIYPGFLLFTALVVCPLLKAIFLGGVENLLINLAFNALRIVLVILSLLIVFRFFNSRYIGRRILHGLALRLPFFHKPILHVAKSRFAKTLACLYSAGLPVRESFREAAQTAGNEAVSAKLLRASHVFEEGGNLSQAVALCGLFDPIALGMISTGEEAGKLDMMLHKYAQFEEQEAEQEIRVLSRLIPLLVYFSVAAYVIYVVMSGYLSYFAMIQSVM